MVVRNGSLRPLMNGVDEWVMGVVRMIRMLMQTDGKTAASVMVSVQGSPFGGIIWMRVLITAPNVFTVRSRVFTRMLKLTSRLTPVTTLLKLAATVAMALLRFILDVKLRQR